MQLGRLGVQRSQGPDRLEHTKLKDRPINFLVGLKESVVCSVISREVVAKNDGSEPAHTNKTFLRLPLTQRFFHACVFSSAMREQGSAFLLLLPYAPGSARLSLQDLPGSPSWGGCSTALNSAQMFPFVYVSFSVTGGRAFGIGSSIPWPSPTKLFQGTGMDGNASLVNAVQRDSCHQQSRKVSMKVSLH